MSQDVTCFRRDRIFTPPILSHYSTVFAWPTHFSDAYAACRGWEGNRRSGVALAVHYRLQWSNQGLKAYERDMSILLPTLQWTGVWHRLPGHHCLDDCLTVGGTCSLLVVYWRSYKPAEYWWCLQVPVSMFYVENIQRWVRIHLMFV